ncbi:two-component sensor histidine kinase [Paenibacillus selenitireducens]|uniref:histidine kinase n=2 Tax=Paenibacillus selenitireducens TaxID=1324314 RepID=A0A1T2XI05_9BACL|nr:two-component sensor histidine kinase [Paenibacillus selenitireducens]
MPVRPKNPGYLPIGYKLMFTFMIFIIIPVLVIGYVSHAMYQDSIRKQTTSNIQGTLLQIKDNIEYKLEDVTRVSGMLYYDYSLATQLRSYREGWESFERTTKYIMPKLNIALNATGMNLWMSIFLENDTLPEVYNGSFDNENPDALERSYGLYHLKRIEDKPWYLSFPVENYGHTMQWKQVERDGDFDRISLLRRMVDSFDPVRLKEIGFMRLSVRISELFQSADYHKIGEGSVITILDEKDTVMYQSGVLSSELLHQNESESHYLTIEENLNNPSWKLVAYIPTNIMEKDSLKVRMFVIAVCFLCLVVFTFAGVFISRYFSIRINKFVSVLNAFREGDLHKRISYRGKDEFSQIATALNEMGENIGDLIKEVYLTQLQKKEAELETLQSQINPHFLYNTLSSINRLAKFGETEKVQQTVLELAKFYRLTLNEGRTMIPVPTEIEQANAYLEIQKIKYGDRMEVMFDVDPDIWPYETMKLVLQPFIENVMKHAWCADRIHIRIVGQRDGDDILFRIIDDGIGMKQERIDQIFDFEGHVNAGYGIRNVDQRIKLQYGAGYGVSIYSKLGIGTSVQIRIPARRRK